MIKQIRTEQANNLGADTTRGFRNAERRWHRRLYVVLAAIPACH